MASIENKKKPGEIDQALNDLVRSTEKKISNPEL